MRHSTVSPTAHILLALLSHAGGTGAGAPLTSQVWTQIIDLARRHGVAPLLHRALQARGSIMDLPEPSRRVLEEDRHGTALENLHNYGEFRRIAQALHEKGISIMPLKGLHLAEIVYDDISLRPMNDLDILVPVSQLRPAISTVFDLGYGGDRSLAETAHGMRATKCDVELYHRHTGRLLEVHWSLEEPPGRYAGLLEDIWHRAAPASVGDTTVPVMAPELLLLHVCAHVSCHHVFAFNLRALCDIAEIVRVYPSLDWPVFVDHSRRCGWNLGVSAALRLASDHLGVAVPADVSTALGTDAISPDVLADAMEQLSTHVDLRDRGFEWHHAVNWKTIAGQPGAAKKLATVWRRIFVPRAELAMRYGVPPESARLTLYYALRLKDLLCRYAAIAWASNASDPALAEATARHARLARWMAGA
jgi:hypothetical protein